MNDLLIQQLQQLRMTGIADMLKQQRTQPNTYSELAFEERLSLLVDHEMNQRRTNRINRLRKQARLRLSATPEELSYGNGRGLDKSRMADLLAGGYLNHHQNIIITGATGGGKTYVACALAEQACRQSIRARYWRLPRLNEHLHIGHADGSYTKQLAHIAKQQLLILDDWGLEKLTIKQATDLLEVVEDRHGVSSTIICSQLPVEQWHSMISNGTVADALLDRLIHNAHRITLSGESMRKQQNMR